MTSFKPIKVLHIFMCSTLIFIHTAWAQDSLKRSTQTQLTWLIKLAHLSTLQEANDSLEIRGYRLSHENENGTDVTIIYRHNISRKLILISSDDGERITSCTYSVDTKTIFDQAITLVKAKGFHSFKGFNSSDGELAFAKENSLVVFSSKASKNGMTYLIVTSKLNLELP